MSIKTFDLVPVVDRVNPGGEKVKSSIQCIEQIFENLYLGTSDCFIVHYCIEKGTNNIGKTIFMNRLQRNKNLALRKPIVQLLGLPTIGQILVLIDGCVSVVSMYGLEFLRGTPSRDLLRNITVMARNTKPLTSTHGTCQICVGTRRKTIQIITISADECTVLKEINLQGVPSTLSMYQQFICSNVGNQYYMIDFTKSNLQELFMYEAHVKPVVKQLSSDEFLLSGPTDMMGMIVTSKGLSMHQPLSFLDGCQSVAFSYPYILVLGESSITVHSILDQQQKQGISFTGGVLITDFDGQVFIAMQRSVMAFLPVPFNKQIQMLLIDKRIDEAFDLLIVSSKLNPKQYDQTYVKQVKAQAAFVHFADGQFSKALPLFVESCVDPREVIVLYPMMMPSNKNFTPSRPLLHNIKDLTEIVKGSKSVFADSKKMLLNYLEGIRNNFENCKEEIDTTLLKLYAECNHANLSDLITNQNSIFPAEALTWLTQCKRHHALALFHSYLQQHKKSLDIWHKLMKGELTDDKFPGISFVAQFLTDLKDISLVWTSSSWVMKEDQKLGASIFIKREDSSLNSDQVSDFLQKYPIALQSYLEHLVYEKESRSEQHHTHLANIYVDRVVSLLNNTLKEKSEVEEARSKLQSLLESSSLYRVSTVLQKISHFPLYKELATLYGKIDQHQKALKILIYQLKDFDAAEHYCDTIVDGKESFKKQRIFLDLLQIYLYPDPNESNLGPEHYVVAAKTLLNKRQKEFNIVSVLNIIPEEWTVNMVQGFLRGSMRERFSATRESKIESNLQKQFYLQTKEHHITRHKDVVKMTDERLCDFCRKPFTESTAARYPNGKVVHIRCSGNKSMCPVTGKKFK
ncbi:transforming growth factor-beta receptor-associated protein 1 homolog [Clytia hemisphaerica]|uniref:CNH domain-containing protein n=1 Tax=Clytia hemisphaerica TaxID=252671 RepID=A0A7M5VAQ5_9CNID